jgi:hypothetical protein
MAGGMAGMGAAQDEAAKNAVQAQLLGLQGQNLNLKSARAPPSTTRSTSSSRN